MINAIFLTIFVLVIISIGIWSMKKISSVNDFFLGSRTIGAWLSGIAYGTTYFSAVLFIGFAGKLGWGFGINVLWIALGNVVIGCYLSWKVLGKRTRRMTNNLNALTMPEFFNQRYLSPALKIFSSLIIFIFLLPYSASVFKGLGHLFEISFNIPYDLALFSMILLTGVYLVLGGYFAIAINDLVMGVIMFFGSILMVITLSNHAGGLMPSISTIITNYSAHIPVGKQAGWLTLASLVFMTSFGTWGLPQMIQKFYAIKDESLINKAAIITTVFATVIVFAAYFIGSMTHVFFTSVPIVEGQPVFDLFIPTMLNQYLPPYFMAVILILIISASMSTLSSLVLVSASALVMDFYNGTINKKASQKQLLILMRVLSGIFIICSWVIARFQFSVIVTLMSLSWGVVAGSFMAPYVYGLFWKKTTKLASWAGMISGFLTAIILFYALPASQSPLSASIAMIVPFFVIPIVSLLTKPLPKETIEIAFK
ncbi:MAG: sodium transporter [Candidatus Margulisbacteria bacterium]|nr:sodium transporter [Candidatus Margulisiibacteriota bacterium]